MAKKPLKSLPIQWGSLYDVSSFIQMTIGVGLALLALKGFMIPNHFIDGGAIGVSILIHEIYHINISLLLLMTNAVFIFLAYRYVSKEVAIKTIITIVLLAIGLEFIPVTPITTDKLLIAIFGGAIIGIGIGMVIRTGGMIDGTEILAVLTRRRIGLTMSEVILLINAIIFSTVAIELGIETAMYSFITYFTATKAIDYVVDGIEEYTALTIISSKNEEVKSAIVNQFGKGITVYKGERGYLPGAFDIKHDCDVIVTIVTRLELLSIKSAIMTIDPYVFMHVHSIRETSGGVLKQKFSH